MKLIIELEEKPVLHVDGSIGQSVSLKSIVDMPRMKETAVFASSDDSIAWIKSTLTRMKETLEAVESTVAESYSQKGIAVAKV